MLGCCAVASATVYKWVDANGVVHYSDQPQPGAEKVHVDQPQSYRGADTAAAANSGNSAAESEESSEGSCDLESPAPDEVLMNTSTVSGKLRMNLKLNPGDHIAVTLDGQRYDTNDASGVFTLTDVYRGTHTLSAIVLSADGETRCQTTTITFHVRQPSVASPTTPVHPK